MVFDLYVSDQSKTYGFFRVQSTGFNTCNIQTLEIFLHQKYGPNCSQSSVNALIFLFNFTLANVRQFY